MSKKFAQIGVGRMGMSHIQAARQIGMDLVGLCDTNQTNLESARESTGVDLACLNLDELLAKSEHLDFVFVATTADSHRETVERVVKSEVGVSGILCEKPMATSIADCLQMIEVCDSYGVRLAINHQMRYMDQYRLVKSDVDSARFGALASMNVVGGNFGFSMNGTHYCEAFRWLTGSRITKVAAWFEDSFLENPRGPNFFDRAGEARFESADGQRLWVSVGSDQGHGMTVTYATRFGHIFVDELEGAYLSTCRKEQHRDFPTTRYGMPWDRQEVRFPQADNVSPTMAVINDLIKGAGYPSGANGLEAVSSLVAAHRSSELGGQLVNVDDLGDYTYQQFPWA